MTGFNFISNSIPELDLSTSISTNFIYFTSNQGRSSKSALSVIAAISPLVQELVQTCSCISLDDHHFLLPQVDDADLTLLVQFVKVGSVTTSLKFCSRLLEILKMIGVNTSNVILEKRAKIIKEETNNKDDVIEDKEESDDEEINIVYEGQSNNVPRADRVSFIEVKSEDDNMIDNSAPQVVRTCSGKLTPLVAPTPPSSSSSLYTSSLQWQEVVSLGMAWRLEQRGNHMTSMNSDNEDRRWKDPGQCVAKTGYFP